MAELSVGAIGAAFEEQADYLPLSAIADVIGQLPPARYAASGIPPERLMALLPEESDAPDPAARALAALGVPARDQPLFLVRSDPPRDSMIAGLSRLVHGAGWAGEDVGITHLGELGGTMIFDLLRWAVPEETGATAVICDEPLFADTVTGQARFAAVGLRLASGPGPLRVLGCGEGAPAVTACNVFSGTGPCDSWLALHAALSAGEIVDGESVLLHTRGPVREGWLSLRAVDVGALVLAGDADRVAVGAGGLLR